MGDLIVQQFQITNSFIVLEEVMVKHFMDMYKNERKQKHNGLNYANYRIYHFNYQAVL